MSKVEFFNAARAGDVATLKDVVRRCGAETLDSDVYDEAFYEACTQGHLDAVKYLIEQGADPHADNGWSLECAATEGHLEIMKYIASKGVSLHYNNEYIMELVIRANHQHIIEFLLDNGADVNAGNNTLLRVAIEYSSLDIIDQLINRGADIHHKNFLPLAVRLNKIDVVTYLLDKGVDPHANYNAAIRSASDHGYTTIIKLLIDRGASPFIGSPNGGSRARENAIYISAVNSVDIQTSIYFQSLPIINQMERDFIEDAIKKINTLLTKKSTSTLGKTQ